MKGEINFPGTEARSAAHQPDEADPQRQRNEAGEAQMLGRDGGNEARHLHKKSRGQCVDQPLDNQKEGKTCKQIRHGHRQLPTAGVAGAAGAAGAAGVADAPCDWLKYRKNSVSGDSTMVVPLLLSAPV